MEPARLIEAPLGPGRLPRPGRGGRGLGRPHLGRVPRRRLRLQGEEAGRPRLPRLHHPRQAPPLLPRRRSGSTAGWPRTSTSASCRSRGPTAGLRVEGDGEVVEWAVKMRRLPDEATLLARLPPRRRSTSRWSRRWPARVAAFHARGRRRANGSRRSAGSRRWPGNARENFDQAGRPSASRSSRAVFDRLRALTETALTRLAAADRRAGPPAACRATRTATCTSTTSTTSRTGRRPPTWSSSTASSSTSASASPTRWPTWRSW